MAPLASIMKSKERNSKRYSYIARVFPELVRCDVYTYPSYTNLELPYDVVCRQRYTISRLEQEDQFEREVRMFEMLQPKGIDGVRLYRQFTPAILSPLITDESKLKTSVPDPLTPAERRRLNAMFKRF